MVMTKSKRGNVGRKISYKRSGRYLLKRYNLTKTEYNKLYQKQNSQCDICGCLCENYFDESALSREIFYVDHCHKTGKVRGLLCSKCNSMIGFCDDNIEILLSGIKYLRKNK